MSIRERFGASDNSQLVRDGAPWWSRVDSPSFDPRLYEYREADEE